MSSAGWLDTGTAARWLTRKSGKPESLRLSLIQRKFELLTCLFSTMEELNFNLKLQHNNIHM
jgi:hypothetical protein